MYFIIPIILHFLIVCPFPRHSIIIQYPNSSPIKCLLGVLSIPAPIVQFFFEGKAELSQKISLILVIFIPTHLYKLSSAFLCYPSSPVFCCHCKRVREAHTLRRLFCLTANIRGSSLLGTFIILPSNTIMQFIWADSFAAS